MGYNENAAYFERMFPYAKAASSATGLPISFILAQWGHETGFGTSDVAQNANNHAGIKYVEGASISNGKYGAYASYSNLAQFVQDYARVMNLSYYKSVRGLGNPEATIAAIGKTPYAEDPNYASKIQGIFSTYGLRGYDTYQGGGGTTDLKSMAGSFLDSVGKSVGDLGSDDLKKYAAIGLAVGAIFAVISK